MFKLIENWLQRLIAEEVAKVAGDLEKAQRTITAREAEVLTSIEEKRADVEQSFRAAIRPLDSIAADVKFLAESERRELIRKGHTF